MKIPLYLRWSDGDQFDHINNAVFATLLEEARARLFWSSSDSTKLLNNGVVVASQSIEFIKPLHYQTEPVSAEISVTEIGTSSFKFGYRLVDTDGSLAATATSTMVSVDLTSGRPKRLTDSDKAWLATIVDSEDRLS